MIIMTLLTVFISVVLWPITLIPSLPALSEDITNGLDTLIANLTMPLGIMHMFLGTSFFTIVIPLIVVLLNFELAMGSIMWVLKKIPIVNIK